MRPRDPLEVPAASRHACGKGRFGVQVARRGGWLLTALAIVVAAAVVAAVT